MKAEGQTLDTEQVLEIATTLNVRPEDVREMEVRMSGREMSLENQDDDEDHYAPIAYLSDEGQEDPVEVLNRRESDEMQGSGLERALATLDDRSRRIVQARWLKEEGGVTLHDLAEEYGVSAERIRQIESAAMKKMKLALAH